MVLGITMDARTENIIETEYDVWLYENEEAILIELAENGADREMDFDLESEFDKRYQQYLTNYRSISMIKAITVEVIEPLEKKRHGGIIYHVQTEEGVVVTVQLEGDIWYEPNYGVSSNDLLEVVAEVIKLDKEMCES